MHACGHDMHMTCWVGTARVLAAHEGPLAGHAGLHRPAGRGGRRRRPADARGRPVQALSAARLLPGPALRLAASRTATSPTPRAWLWPTSIRWTSPSAARAATARPRTRPSTRSCWRPASSSICKRIVSRETNPTDPAVVTVGSIHGGTKHNIIPAEVKLQLTVRTPKDDVRKHVLEGIERIAKAAARGRQGAGADRPHRSGRLHAGAVQRRRRWRKKTTAVFREMLGKDKVHEAARSMGGEDFGRYGREGVPIFFYFLGTMAPERVAAAEAGRQAAAVAALGPVLSGARSRASAPAC